MSTQRIISQVSDRVALITLNRPEVLNAFAGTMREELLAALEQAADDRAVRCVMITGAGRAFCAGGDIASMAELQADNNDGVIKERTVVGGKIIRLRVADIRVIGRNTQGVRLIDLDNGERVVSLTRLAEEDG